MKSINTFQVLKRIPNVSDDEAKTVASSIAHIGDVATKNDINTLRAETKAELAELKFSLIKWNMAIVSIAVTVIKLL